MGPVEETVWKIDNMMIRYVEVVPRSLQNNAVKCRIYKRNRDNGMCSVVSHYESGRTFTKYASISSKLDHRFMFPDEQEKPVYIIVSKKKSNGEYSMSSHPRFHNSYESARQEATRLARIEPTKKFIIVEPKKAFETQDVVETGEF